MKRNVIIGLLNLFLCFFTFEINAQIDSVNIGDSVNLEYVHKRKHQYLDVNFREEKTLLKAGISPLGFLSESGELAISSFSSTIGVEQKIIPSLSIANYNDFDYRSIDNELFGWVFSTAVALRYYYRMNKRIKRSEGANNFHSNYFSIGLNECVRYRHISQKTIPKSNFLVYSSHSDWSFSPIVFISWGFQRRIGKWFFVDAAPYVELKNVGYGLGVNFLFGIAKGWKY